MSLKQMVFLLLAGLLCLLISQNSRAQEQEYDTDNWTYDHFLPVFNEVFPFEEEAEVSFRAHGDYERDILEYSFSIVEKPDRSVEVVARMADTVPVFIQLMRLHLKNRGASAESFKKQLKIKEWRLTGKTCPATKTLIPKFDELRLPVTSKQYREDKAKGVERVVLHAVVYDVEADIWGGRIKLQFWGFEDEHPLLDWMTETRQVIEKCVPARRDKAKH